MCFNPITVSCPASAALSRSIRMIPSLWLSDSRTIGQDRPTGQKVNCVLRAGSLG